MDIKILNKIPVIRSIIRKYKKSRCDKAWRKVNQHNDSIVGDRIFPINNVSVGKGSYGILNIQSLFEREEEKLIIGNFVSIAPGVLFLLGVNHQMNTITTFPFKSRLVKRGEYDALLKGPIIIEDEVWIGTNAIIMSNVKIGKGAIIAAGAVVVRDIEPYSIYGGNPAKFIKKRFSEEIITELNRIEFSKMDESEIKKCLKWIYTPITNLEDAKFVVEKILNREYE